MNSIGYCAPNCGSPADFDEVFCLSGPLPIIGPGERSDYFMESEIAHAHYIGHRSINALANTMTYHVVDEAGEIAGFISFRLAREDGLGLTRIYNSVEYMYVMQRFRGLGLSKLLLEPLMRAVATELHMATGTHRKPMVYLHSASQAQSPGGKNALRNFEETLLELAKRRRGVRVVGQYVGRPVIMRRSSLTDSRALEDAGLGS